jgi:hypothetical protein
MPAENDCGSHTTGEQMRASPAIVGASWRDRRSARCRAMALGTRSPIRTLRKVIAAIPITNETAVETGGKNA